MLSDIVNKIRAQRDHEPTVISLGQTWVDTLMRVPEMPQAGRFVEASTVSRSIGGSFQVLEAAERMGARTELASMMGTGPWADCIARALRQAHIVHTGRTLHNQDNGMRIILSDGDAKSYVAHHGAESRGDADAFKNIHPKKGDVVHIGSNALMNDGAVAVHRFLSHPACQPQTRTFRIVLNSTRALRLVNAQLLETLILARPVWSMNRQQAYALAERLSISIDETPTLRVSGGFDESMHELCTALSEVLRAPVVLRAGSRGAWIRQHGEGVMHIDGFPTKATHIRSAGPVHTGALCALLAEGWDLEASVQIANAAAALSIAHNVDGVPVCPSYDEATAFIKERLAE